MRADESHPASCPRGWYCVWEQKNWRGAMAKWSTTAAHCEISDWCSHRMICRSPRKQGAGEARSVGGGELTLPLVQPGLEFQQPGQERGPCSMVSSSWAADVGIKGVATT
ncbi:peptidase inhibitor family I36 protein [Streptomyces sp. 3N207]|uniref:peptidase inhibitor family I36 protein n=1 Tax=Streptomyces sp. 3N207 TaxID=3457417 RepID=UPI003FCF27B5